MFPSELGRRRVITRARAVLLWGGVSFGVNISSFFYLCLFTVRARGQRGPGQTVAPVPPLFVSFFCIAESRRAAILTNK